MNAAPLNPTQPSDSPRSNEICWSVWRWMAYLTLAFAGHVGLFYALSDRHPLPPRVVKNAAPLVIASNQNELQQLDDPTLFALPHPRGFAGETWLRLPQIKFAPFRWTEPLRLLPLPIEQLGTVFLHLAETNAPASREIHLLPPPQTSLLLPNETPVTPRPALLRVNGELAGRALRNAPQLELQPAQDGLTNTVVQVLVDARGQVISATLIPPPINGAKEADQDALRISRNLRFNAINDPAKLMVGRLIFEWNPLPTTNAPATTR